jgi:hypothetical protein
MNSFAMSVLAVVAFRLKMDAKETSVVWLDRCTEQQTFRNQSARIHRVGVHFATKAPVANFRERQEGSPTEFATLYRIEFWKMDLGAFTGRGQGGPCLTDAAQ